MCVCVCVCVCVCMGREITYGCIEFFIYFLRIPNY